MVQVMVSMAEPAPVLPLPLPLPVPLLVSLPALLSVYVYTRLSRASCTSSLLPAMVTPREPRPVMRAVEEVGGRLLLRAPSPNMHWQATTRGGSAAFEWEKACAPRVVPRRKAEGRGRGQGRLAVQCMSWAEEAVVVEGARASEALGVGGGRRKVMRRGALLVKWERG